MSSSDQATHLERTRCSMGNARRVFHSGPERAADSNTASRSPERLAGPERPASRSLSLGPLPRVFVTGREARGCAKQIYPFPPSVSAVANPTPSQHVQPNRGRSPQAPEAELLSAVPKRFSSSPPPRAAKADPSPIFPDHSRDDLEPFPGISMSFEL